jgi:hypothetical protein
VPTNCKAVHTQIVKKSGRGQIIPPVEPTAGNGFRGEVEISDPQRGAAVYDFTVTLSCAGSAPPQTARLGCSHSVGTGSCHQGRMEVLNPKTKQWGTVCGHYLWDNDQAAHILCRQLGCT